MARGKTSTRKSIWRGIGYLVLAAMTLLVAGFIVRRDLGPALWFYVTHRAPPRQAAEPARSSGAAPRTAALVSGSGGVAAVSGSIARPAGNDDTGVGAGRRAASAVPHEDLAAPDRQALDEIIRKRAE